jgi:type III restriction enzyme
VFQICTLKHGGDSTTQKRQEVGRGLRLCVNEAGDRMDADMCGDEVQNINMLTVIASESYKTFVEDLQSDIKSVLYDRPTKASIEFFEGKTVMCGGKPVTIDANQAKSIYRYLLKNDYIDDDDKVTDAYRADLANGCLAPLPLGLQEIAEGVHSLIQSVFDESALKDMINNAHDTKVRENPLNDNYYKEEFQTLWNYINHKYAYTVEFDSDELIRKAIDHINDRLFVSQLQYTTSIGQQKDVINEYEIDRGESFDAVKTRTQTLRNGASSQVEYDLIGKIAEGTVLTRRTIAAILSGISMDKFYMFRNNPEEFITKVIKLIKEQKATTIIAGIKYNKTEGEYSSKIFTAEKSSLPLEKAFKTTKAIQDYVFTDGYAADGQSVERRFVSNLDTAEEVVVYAKLPKGFSILTPVGNYSPDWAIAFKEGTVKHIYFIAETKGTMDSLQFKPIETTKIQCAKKLFNDLSTSKVRYEAVDSYQNLLGVMEGMK